MTKEDSDKTKIYSNIKIKKLDPLSEKLDAAGFTGGASTRGLRYDKILQRLIPEKQFKLRELQREKSKLEMHKNAKQPTKGLSLKNIDARLDQINIDIKNLK